MDKNWLMQGLVWEFAAAVVMTIMARIFKWTTGKHMKPKHEIAFWACGIIGFFVILEIAQIGIMRPLATDREQSREDYMQVTHPNFSCTIGMVGVGYLQPQDKTGVTVMAVIVNRGANSVARSWYLHAKLPSGEVLTAPAELSLTNDIMPNQLGMTLNSENDLPAMFLHYPMVGGSAMDGWAIFIFDKKYFDELNRSGVIFTMSFVDSYQMLTVASETNYAVNDSGLLKYAP